MGSSGKTPKAPPPSSDSLDDWFDFGDALAPRKPAANDPTGDISRRVTPLAVEAAKTPPVEAPVDPFSLDAPDLWDWEVEPTPDAAETSGPVPTTAAIPPPAPSQPPPSALDVADFFDPFDALDVEPDLAAPPPSAPPPPRTTLRPSASPTGSEAPTHRPTKIPHPSEFPALIDPTPEVVEVEDDDLSDFAPDDELQFDPTAAQPRAPIPTLPPVTPAAVSKAEPSRVVSADSRREMHERFDLGDFTGALVLAEGILEHDRNDREAKRVADVSRARLQAIYAGRLGSLDQVPAMAVARSELRWLSLDHRAGFVLSLVDGTSSLEEIVDISAMPPLEVLRTLYTLVTQRVIELRPPRLR